MILLPRRARRARQQGQSLVSTILIVSVAALLVVATLAWGRASTSQSTYSARGDIALQAAEAGLQQYMARVVESRKYWTVYVDTAEDPRVSTTSGLIRSAGQEWLSGQPWRYNGPPTNWRTLEDAEFGEAAYSVRVYPEASGTIRVQSTARVMPSGGKDPVIRSVMATLRPLNLTDFQMVSDKSINYGATATTWGKLYSNENISHMGRAKAEVYARNLVCRSTTASCSTSHAYASQFEKGARDRTTNPPFRSVFPNPIDFSTFSYDRIQFRQSAQTPGLGVYRTAPDARGWLVQFPGNGQVHIWKLTSTWSVNLETTLPKLECPEVVNLRGGNLDNFLYFEQPVVIGNGTPVRTACDSTPRSRDSIVDGRVSIATSSSIYIGGNISYQTEGRDVLGLMAAQNIVMAGYAPYNLTWRAATLAESGQWRTASGVSTNSKGTLVFKGSIATAQGGFAQMYSNRDYQWDDKVDVSGAPPMFPDVDGSLNTIDWREVAPPQ